MSDILNIGETILTRDPRSNRTVEGKITAPPDARHPNTYRVVLDINGGEIWDIPVGDIRRKVDP
jgi:hypothetical protein